MSASSGAPRHVPMAGARGVPPGFREALGFWARLGRINFGGPAGQIAMMHRELVERRRWVDETAFVHGLNYCMLLPGPEAMQLATRLGWRLHGLRGGIAAGALFVLPATVILAVLAWVYLRFGQVPAVSSALLGVQAAVLAIIAQALLRIGGKVLRTPFALVLALSSLLAIGLRWPFPLVIGGAAVVGLTVTRIRPHWLSPPHHGVGGRCDDHPIGSFPRPGRCRHARAGADRGVVAAPARGNRDDAREMGRSRSGAGRCRGGCDRG